MLIFQLLNQYEGIAKAAMFGRSAKLNKSFKTNIIEILLLIMCIPRKINFLQLGRYGSRCEQCYRQTAERAFDWLGFNMNLAARYFHQYGKGFGRLDIAIDPSYVSKAGKMTDHIGRFWSGCAAAVKHGLEILGIGLVDADMKDCIMLRAVQTKKYDGRIDFDNPDKSRMNKMAIDPADGTAYELIAWSKALGRLVRLVIHYLPNGSHRLYFSTDAQMRGVDVYEIYRTRFQIEFYFRDGHQFTGLLDCQSRGEKTLDFAYNASLAAINITKVMVKELCFKG